MSLEFRLDESISLYWPSSSQNYWEARVAERHSEIDLKARWLLSSLLDWLIGRSRETKLAKEISKNETGPALLVQPELCRPRLLCGGREHYNVISAMQRVWKSGQGGPASSVYVYEYTTCAELPAPKQGGCAACQFSFNPHRFLHLLHNRPHVPECTVI